MYFFVLGFILNHNDWLCYFQRSNFRQLDKPLRTLSEVNLDIFNRFSKFPKISDHVRRFTKKIRKRASKPDRHTKFFLITNSSTGMQHLICDVRYICGSFYFDLKTPVMKLTSTIRKDKKERQERCKVLKDQAKKSRQNCDQL